MTPVVEGLGYRVWHLELAGGGRSQQLRLYIDAPDGVGLDDCVQVSREVSAALDVEDPISGHYSLEVSSPGMDRPLIKVEHFQEFIGHQAKISLYAPQDGRRRFRGELLAADAEAIRLQVDGETIRLPLADVAKARLAPTYETKTRLI